MQSLYYLVSHKYLPIHQAYITQAQTGNADQTVNIKHNHELALSETLQQAWDEHLFVPALSHIY